MKLNYTFQLQDLKFWIEHLYSNKKINLFINVANFINAIAIIGACYFISIFLGLEMILFIGIIVAIVYFLIAKKLLAVIVFYLIKYLGAKSILSDREVYIENDKIIESCESFQQEIKFKEIKNIKDTSDYLVLEASIFLFILIPKNNLSSTQLNSFLAEVKSQKANEV